MGVEAWARESWNSGGGVAEEGVVVVAGGVGEMRSSRHCGVVEVVVGLRMVVGPVGVVMVEGLAEGDGATDWKAWMGRASKNSWANMKGVLSVSGVWLGLCTEGGGREKTYLWARTGYPRTISPARRSTCPYFDILYRFPPSARPCIVAAFAFLVRTGWSLRDRRL